MKKRIMSALFAMCLLLGLVVVPAAAEEEGNVCVIGGTGYSSLTAAVTAASIGDTIWMTADDPVQQQITIEKSLTIELQGFSLSSTALKISGSGTTVALNDRTGTASINTDKYAGFTAAEIGRCDATIYVTGGATLTISGKTGSDASTGTIISECANRDLEKAVFLGSGTLTIDGGTFVGTKGSGCDALFVYSGAVTINDGYFSDSCGLSYNTAPSDENPLIIRKGVFDGGIWIEKSGTINGKSFSSGRQSVENVQELFLSRSTESVVSSDSTEKLIKIVSALFLSDTAVSQTLPDGSRICVGSGDQTAPEVITVTDGAKIILQPQILGGDGTPITYEWKKNGVTIDTATEGNYTIEAPIAPGDTYTLTATQNGKSVTAYYVVGKAAPTVTPPTANTLTYTGEPQDLVTAGSAIGGTMQYSLDGSSYSTDIPTGTDAGDYTVWYKVVGDANHTDTGPVCLTVTIGKSDADVTGEGVTITYGENVTLTVGVAPKAAGGIALTSADSDEVEFVFPNGKAKTAAVDKSSGENGTATLTIEANEVKDYLKPGENTVTVNYGGSGNLNEENSVTITVTVNKKSLNFTFTATDRAYNGSNVVTGSLTPTDLVGSDNVTATLQEGGATAASANTGTQTVTVDTNKVELGGTDADYYMVGAVTGGTVTISKATIGSVTAPTVENPTYNGEEQALLSGSGRVPEGAAITYFVGKKNDSSTPSGSEDGWGAMDAIKARDAGTYTVWYKVAGGTNYEDVGPAKLGEAAIRQKEVTLTWKLDGGETFTVDYTGGAHTVTAEATGLVAGDECVLTVGEHGVQTDAGTYTAKITEISNANYKLPADVTKSYTILKAPVTFTIGAEDKPSHDWKEEAKEDPNPEGYVIAEDADPAVWNDFALTMTYDSLAHRASVRQDSGVAMGGGLFTVSYQRVKDAAGNAVTEEAGETFRAAGTYEIRVTLTGDARNFMFAGEAPDARTLCIGAVTVKPYEVRVTWQNLTFVYHGHAMHPTVRVENAFLADEQPNEGFQDPTTFHGDLMAYAVTDSADVGDHPVKVTLYGSEAGNYTVSNPAATVVIQPAPVVFEVTDNEWLYQEEGGDRNVTLTAAWGEVTNAPDTVLNHGYPVAGTEIALEDLGVTAEDIQYRLADGTVVDNPAGIGTYQVWVRIPNANYRHAGSAGGGFHNVGVLRIATNDHPATYTVTFDPGRDEKGNRFTDVTVPAPMTGLIPTQAITLPPAPENAPEGYAFAGWSRGGALYQPNEEFYMPYSNVTFEARWTKEIFHISGVVIDNAEDALPYVSVALMMGEHQIALTTTDKDGIFRFDGLIPNTYNLVFTWNGVVKTYMVEITDKNVEGGTYALPGYRLNTVVEVAPGSGSVVVDLDPIITDEKASELYNTDERALVEDYGGTVEFKMKVEDSSAAEGMTEKLKDVPVSADHIGMVLDMSLTKTVTALNSDGTADTTVTPIDDSKVFIANLIYLPADLQGKDGYTVYRFHDEDGDGKAEVQAITTGANRDGERVEIVKNGTAIMVYARYYSTYVLTWYQNPPVVDMGGRVTVADTPHGTVTPNRPSAAPGITVTLTVKPEEGYEADGLTVTDSIGREVPVTDNGDGTYSFIMPGGSVTVKASFRLKRCDGGENCPSRRFADLDVEAWYHEYTDYVIAHELMRGMGGTSFAPDGAVTRAQMVMVLWNLAGGGIVDYQMTYEDVTEGAWYAEAVRWASSEGVVKGYSAARFGPDDPITREQMATMLYRYEQRLGGGGFTGDWMFQLPFADAEKVGNWAYEAVAWCSENGVIEGRDGNVFDPASSAKRCEMAAVFTRYLTLER